MAYNLLKNVRVIESSAFIAAPLCGLTLAQLGADVIRFDLIGGGIDYRRVPVMPNGRSLYWISLNRGKRSIAIDIRRPDGRRLLKDLITASGRDGGILLTNVAARWLSHDDLARERADLITCVIEGNPDGSSAVDYTVNCATGLPMATGASKDLPVNHVLPAWDIICALQASLALIGAVDRRRRSGEGAAIRIALSDVAFSALSYLGILAEVELLGQERLPIGNDIYGAFGRDFATRDGERVMVAAISLRQWQALVSACEISGPIAAIEAAIGLNFSRETDRFEGRDVIAGLVKRWCLDRTLREVAEAFEKHGVCWGRYQTFGELVGQDPRVSLKNEMFEMIDTPGVGTHRAAGTPIRIKNLDRFQSTPAPLIGADTDEILEEVLGLGSREIGRLHDAGIVAGPEAEASLLAERDMPHGLLGHAGIVTTT
jgi:2-methylfumaryl-CoA isomerase